MKQAGRQWNKKLDKVLQSMGFDRVQCDNSIWIYRKDDMRIILPVYVDDMTIVSKSKTDIAWVKTELRKHFKLRDLGPISFLLGVWVERERSKRQLTLCQKQFIIDLLDNFFPDQQLRPVITPLDPSTVLTKDMCPKTDEEKELMRNKPYAQLVGTLMYLAIATRPDIAKAVGVLLRFTANPGITHWKGAVHLCCYLAGTMDFKLTYAPDFTSKKLFTAYSDADYGGKADSRCSTSGMVVKMGTGAISWASRLQTTVTLSTTEAEYVSAVAAGQEIIWLHNLFTELGYKLSGPSLLKLSILNTMEG